MVAAVVAEGEAVRRGHQIGDRYDIVVVVISIAGVPDIGAGGGVQPLRREAAVAAPVEQQLQPVAEVGRLQRAITPRI